jgi:16S rRNA (uracil1498-N3)-methyltransferase
MSAPRIFWPEPVVGGVAEIRGDAAHHLRQVLRVAPGAAVGLFDGRGHEWAGRVESVSRQLVRVAGLVQVAPIAEARVPVTLAVGVLKGDQMDAVVRDATMLGVAAIAPMQTAHVTVPPRAWQSGAERERWQRVAVASATQCRRSVVPEVRAVTAFDACMKEPAAVRLMCVEPAMAEPTGGASAAGWQAVPRPASVQILIGPEGGWSSAEVEQALAAGAHPMHLGPRTLRAETTPVVALTMVWATWGW